MRLAKTTHTSRRWRIHELTRDFRLEDVWALPTPGGLDDFPRLGRQIASGGPPGQSSRATRALWAIRWKVGELLGWDEAETGVIHLGWVPDETGDYRGEMAVTSSPTDCSAAATWRRSSRSGT